MRSITGQVAVFLFKLLHCTVMVKVIELVTVEMFESVHVTVYV